MLAVGRQLGTVERRGPDAGLALDAQQRVAFGRTVGQAARQREVMTRERSQLVEAAGRKFPRSATNSATWPRSHINSGNA